MRLIATLFAVVLVGCGEVSPAGGTGAGGDGGGAGAMQEDAAGGASGASGAAGGQAGAGGSIAPRDSCLIPIRDVAGMTSEVVWLRCGEQQTGSLHVTVAAGSVGNFFGEWPTVGSYVAWPHSGGAVDAPTTDGLCNVSIRYDRPQPAGCTMSAPESLFVDMTVPAI